MTKGSSYCPCCKRELSNTKFYPRLEQEYTLLDQTQYCTVCIKKYCDSMYDQFNDLEKAIYYTCALVDMPYIVRVVKKTIEHVESLATKNNKLVTDYKIFDYYHKFLWGNKTMIEKGETWVHFSDSDGFPRSMNSQVVKNEEDDKKIREFIRTWGTQETLEDYEFLIQAYKRYTKDITIKSPTQNDLYRDLCLARLEKRKIEEKREVGDISKTQTRILTLMSKLGLDDFDIDKGKTVSDNLLPELINQVESKTVAEVYGNPELYRDCNGVKYYNELFALRPFGNSLLGQRDFDVDLEDMKNYKIDVPYQLTKNE